jgi:hypothetical protein
MVEKERCCFVENVGKFNENIPSSDPIQMWSSILLDVENVHLQSNNILDVDVFATYEWRSKS